MWTHTACDDLMTHTRTLDAASALVALGTFVTGRPCFVAQGGVALRGLGDTETPVCCSAGNPVQIETVLSSDPALAALGVEAVAVSGHDSPADLRALVGGLVWRAGLMLRMLDAAFSHLSHRESGGQKTLQHQLVKATFTECFALSEQIRLEAPHWLDGKGRSEIEINGDRLSVATTKASKLMGGHGYLHGSLNALECLSFCVSSLMAKTTDTQARFAA